MKSRQGNMIGNKTIIEAVVWREENHDLHHSRTVSGLCLSWWIAFEMGMTNSLGRWSLSHALQQARRKEKIECYNIFVIEKTL